MWTENLQTMELSLLICAFLIGNLESQFNFRNCCWPNANVAAHQIFVSIKIYKYLSDSCIKSIKIYKYLSDSKVYKYLSDSCINYISDQSDLLNVLYKYLSDSCKY